MHVHGELPRLTRKAWFFVFASLCMLLPFEMAVAQNGSVRGALSAPTISIDESVTLTIVAIGVNGELDISALEKDFEVVGRSSSSQVSITNGSTSRTMSWVIEMLPRAVGVFTVPPVKVGTEESQLLTLKVTDSPVGANRELFVEASVDEYSPYVQAQVIVSVRVFQSVNVIDGSLGNPVAESLTVQRLGEDKVYREQRDGKNYQVLERRFAVFPQKSGTTTISPITLTASVPADPKRVQGFFSPTRKLTRRSQPLQLDVQARPSNIAANWWLPAADVSLKSEWSADPANIQVDQPLTRTIRLLADGVSETQLPAIEPPAVSGVSVYADEAESSAAVTDNGLRSEQRSSFAIIPQQPGTITLPAVQVNWFDTDTGEAQVAMLPPETLTILPRAAELSGQNKQHTDNTVDDSTSTVAPDVTPINKQPINEPEIKADNSIAMSTENTGGVAAYWRWLAVFAVSAWVLTIMYIFLGRRGTLAQSASDSTRHSAGNTQRDTNSNAALKAVETACKSNDPAAISQSVLAWGASLWPEHPPRSLASIGKHLAHPALAVELESLDASLYRPTGQTGDDQSVANDEYSTLPGLLVAASEAAALHPPKAGFGNSRTQGANAHEVHLPSL